MHSLTESQLQSIYDEKDLAPHYFTWSINNTGTKEEFLENYVENELLTCGEEVRYIALMQCNGLDYEDSTYNVDSEEYLILTNEEAENEVMESATNYCDDIIMPEVPEYLHAYFDNRAWIDDYIADHDRGEIIAYYDSKEEYTEVNGVTYYIYKR